VKIMSASTGYQYGKIGRTNRSFSPRDPEARINPVLPGRSAKRPMQSLSLQPLKRTPRSSGVYVSPTPSKTIPKEEVEATFAEIAASTSKDDAVYKDEVESTRSDETPEWAKEHRKLGPKWWVEAKEKSPVKMATIKIEDTYEGPTELRDTPPLDTPRDTPTRKEPPGTEPTFASLDRITDRVERAYEDVWGA
jgi:hypothetical protein